MLENNQLYNMDCMEGMAAFPDGYFDLAVVDPPYGIEQFKNAQPSRLSKYGQLSTANDMKPDKAYFNELFRVSKNQIVWGYNHLSDLLPPTKEYLCWYKHQPVPTYGDCELAWTSLTKTPKVFDYPFFGSIGQDPGKFHPMQKPVALYVWILKNYAKPGDKILDTHAGSAASFVAAYEMGFDYVGFEIDETYYKKACEWVDAVMAQTRLA